MKKLFILFMMSLAIAMAAQAENAEEDGSVVKSTFSETPTVYRYEMYTDGILYTAEGNDWDFYCNGPNPNWAKIQVSSFDGEDCLQFILTNRYPTISLTSRFSVESAVKAIIIHAGGNLGKIELNAEKGSAVMNMDASDELKTYTFNLEKDFKPFDNILSINFTHDKMGTTTGGITNRPDPFYIQSITVIYSEGTQEEVVNQDIVSTFKEAYDTHLIAMETGYDWEINTTTEGSSMNIYNTTLSSDESSYQCIYVGVSGTEEVQTVDVTSAFNVKGKVKKIVVRAVGNIFDIYSMISGSRVVADPRAVNDTFNDWTMDFGEGVEIDNNPVSFTISMGDMLFLQTITIVFETESGGEDDGISGTSGDLTWKAEELGFNVGYWGSNGYEEIPAYRLTFSGNGTMADYTSDIIDGRVITNAPWFDLKGITEVVIGEGVIGIGDNAFSELPSIDTVTLPKTLKFIGYDAFSSCGVRNITLPEGLEVIYGYAFSWCSSLTSIIIPSTVTNLSSTSFAGNPLESLTVADGNPLYESPEGSNAVIRKADNVLFIGTPVSVIPGSVTAIGDYAFYNNYNVKAMPIPEGVKAIGKYAFAYSGNIEAIDLPNSIDSIWKSAFAGCSRLRHVVIGKNTKYIDRDVFSDCPALDIVLCYANPDNLTWDDFANARYFKKNKGTNFFVKAADLEKWQTKFADLNVTFVGELPEEEVVDLNGDGRVDMKDGIIVLEAIAKGMTDGSLDMNGDGKVDIADVIAILKSLAGEK